MARGHGKHSIPIKDKSDLSAAIALVRTFLHLRDTGRVAVSRANHPPAADAVRSGAGPQDRPLGRPAGDWTVAGREQAAICLIGGTGIALIVLGSFLPWVISGTVRRSSYQIVGIVGRLGIGESGVLSVLLQAWPFIGVLCVTPVIAAAFRWWRTAGAIAIPIALVAGLLSFGLLIYVASRGGAILRVDPIGPVVMAAGSVLLICAALVLLFRPRSPVRRVETRPLANDQQ